MMLQFFTDIVQHIRPFIGVKLFDHPAQSDTHDISMMKFAAEIVAQL